MKKQTTITAPENSEEMLMNAPIGFFSSTPEGRLKYANPAMARIFGYETPEDLVSSVKGIAQQLYHNPEDRENIKHILEGKEEILDYDSRFRRKDGSIFWGSYSARTLRDKNGNVYAYEGFFQDITRRKEENQNLLKTKFAMDHAPDNIIWIDHDGYLVYVSDSSCKKLGYSRGELLKMKIFDIDPDFPPEIWEQHKEDLRRAGKMLLESRHRTKNGLIYPVEISTNYFMDDGKFLTCVFYRDITERKKRQEELQKAKFAMDRAPDSVMWIATDGHIVYVSDSSCETLGYSRDELLEMEIFDIDPDLSRERLQQLKEDFQRLGKIVFESRHRTKDGRIFPVEVSSNHFTYNDSSLICAFGRDISDRKRMEEALMESEEKYRTLVNNMQDVMFRCDLEGIAPVIE